MAGSVRRRGVAVTALAFVSASTLAFTTASPVLAAESAKSPAYYSGSTSAHVLGVAINLPSVLPELPGIPKNIVLNLIGTEGTATHNVLGTGPKTSSVSDSSLITTNKGSLLDQVLSALNLNKTIKATLGMAPQAFTDIPVDASPLLKVDVGKLAASALGTGNTGESLLAGGTVGELGDLLNLKSTAGSATTLLSSVQGTVNGVSNTVTNQVSNALDIVGNALKQNGLTDTAKGDLQNINGTLQNIQNIINGIINNLGNTAVLKIGVLNATQSIAPTTALDKLSAAKAAAAVSGGSVADGGNVINLLNGLVTVKAYTSHAAVTSNGKTLVPDFTKDAPPIVQVGVSNLLTASLGANGLTLGGSGLPASIQDTVNSALSALQSALNTLLNALGVHIDAVPGSYHYDPATGIGTAFGAGYDIRLDSPIPGDPTLLEVGLGGLQRDPVTGAVHPGPMASISAAQAPHVVKVKNPQAGALPHTGANLPLIGGTGLALLLGAAYMRRRMVQA
jgi:hypothetical protein